VMAIAAQREPVIVVRNLSVEYLTPRGVVKAVRNVNLEVYKGETLFIVGESGSGKSTLGFALLNLVPQPGYIKEGEVLYRVDGNEVNLMKLPPDEQREFRWKHVSMVFQAALNSLNPVMRVWDQLYDTIKAHDRNVSREEAYEKVRNLLSLVRLDADRVLRAYPHQLSGGMRQRVMIAMALLLDPKVVILDEPTTALDLLTQKNIIEVLKNIKSKLGTTMIFITHDLSLAAELADRVAVMYAGRIVELGDVYEVFYRPKHPYTYALMKTVPKLTSVDEELYPIPGSPPDMVNMPPGCKFHPRCPYAADVCKQVEPPDEWVASGHLVACHLWRELKLEVRSP
jgi:peptide/nickel transport system ATP-binding protein